MFIKIDKNNMDGLIQSLENCEKKEQKFQFIETRLMALSLDNEDNRLKIEQIETKLDEQARNQNFQLGEILEQLKNVNETLKDVKKNYDTNLAIDQKQRKPKLSFIKIESFAVDSKEGQISDPTRATRPK
jgi:poly-gamma-glutamate capsule biosynthesis protein CapA/YwtB (metallophosphatase superfamily)